MRPPDVTKRLEQDSFVSPASKALFRTIRGFFRQFFSETPFAALTLLAVSTKSALSRPSKVP
jgi:hypothetical protein